MKLQDFTGPIDLDLTLRDASLNPDVRDTRRAIAAASVGVDPEEKNISEQGRPIKIADGAPIRDILA